MFSCKLWWPIIMALRGGQMSGIRNRNWKKQQGNDSFACFELPILLQWFILKSDDIKKTCSPNKQNAKLPKIVFP